LTLEQLRIFLAVAEREHVTRAAEALNLTQSSVSNAIHALEKRHGVQLFDRIGRRIELTAEGKAFLEQAKAILAMVRSAEATLADLSAVRRGTLTVFASQTISSYWLPAILVRFHETYPRIDLRLEIGNTAQCARAVLNGEADLGFIEGAVEEPALAVELVAKDQLVVVVGAEHPWRKSPPSFPADFTRTEWALREPGSGTRSSFEAALRRFDIPVSEMRITMELPSNEAVCAAVAASQLATAVSETVAHAGVSTGKLFAVPSQLPSRDFSMIRHRERLLSRASEAFRQMIPAGSSARDPSSPVPVPPRRR